MTRRDRPPDLGQLTPSERILYDAIRDLHVMLSSRLSQLEGAVAALEQKKQRAKRTREQLVARRIEKIREAGLRDIERNPELAKLLPDAERFFAGLPQLKRRTPEQVAAAQRDQLQGLDGQPRKAQRSERDRRKREALDRIPRQQAAVSFLKHYNIALTAEAHCKQHEVSHFMGYSDLMALVKAGFLKRSGTGPSASFDLVMEPSEDEWQRRVARAQALTPGVQHALQDHRAETKR